MIGHKKIIVLVSSMNIVCFAAQHAMPQLEKQQQATKLLHYTTSERIGPKRIDVKAFGKFNPNQPLPLHVALFVTKTYKGSRETGHIVCELDKTKGKATPVLTECGATQNEKMQLFEQFEQEYSSVSAQQHLTKSQKDSVHYLVTQVQQSEKQDLSEKQLESLISGWEQLHKKFGQ